MVKSGKKKKVLAGKAQATNNNAPKKAGRERNAAARASKEERRARKMERRKKEKKSYTAGDWAVPAPSHLVARLDVPKVKSKYQSYYEIADNPERKEKRLDVAVTDDANPPPGMLFVPIGDPILTSKCKELSREKGAMIFVVSSWKEENSKISEHIHRTGYHFRETIVEEAREIIGETVISKPNTAPGFIEPIPESQEEINKQADGAIRDLFPRIPHTDRSMIIEHAFKKGGMFHGEPTVGLQTNIPLSRRVQLAVLAHIRHTHTRYDKLLRETSWMNARKAVEPVCLDVLLKWRGDEETGRDQMDEILREVVIITDSEADDSESSDEDSSDEEGEVTSASSAEAPSLPASRNQHRQVQPNAEATMEIVQDTSRRHTKNDTSAISSRTRSKVDPIQQNEKKAQRGFQRYQAALDGAMHRARERPVSRPAMAGSPFNHPTATSASYGGNLQSYNGPQHTSHMSTISHPSNSYQHERAGYEHRPQSSATRPLTYYSQQGPAQRQVQGSYFAKDEVIVRSKNDHFVYHQQALPRLGTPVYTTREQRPPQVVQGSPLKRGPEDMPIPSIETAPSNIASPVREQFGAQDLGDHPQDVNPRRAVDQRLQSLAPREVIVINDDNVAVKRRRVAYDDDYGQSRLVPSRDHDLRVPASSSASHFIPVSSAQLGGFSARHPIASGHLAQGMMAGEPEFYTDPITGERLPIYDAPERRHYVQLPEYRRIVEPVSRREGRSDQLPGSFHHLRDNVEGRSSERTRESYEQLHAMERDQSRYVQLDQQYGPSVRSQQEYSRFQQPSMSNFHHGAISAAPDQNLVHKFSQSHLDEPPSLARDGFVRVSGRPDPGHGNDYVSEHDNRQSRPTLPPNPARARSPIRYVEQPSSREHGLRQPVYQYADIDQIPARQPMRSGRQQYSPAPHNAPSYRQQGNPRPPVYVID